MEKDHLEDLNESGRTIIKFRMDPNKLYDSWWDRYKWRTSVSTYKKVLRAPGNGGERFE